MKVALLGAPGSGKSKFARYLLRRLNSESKSWAVIDGYVDKLQTQTDSPFGFDTSFLSLRANLQVIGARWTLEDVAQRKGLHSITCGSIYESVIYSAAPSLVLDRIADKEILVAETQMVSLAMATLSALEARTFDYDALFYLPLADHKDKSWEGVVDAKIPEVLEGFSRYAIRLNGTHKQKVDNATEIIQAILKASSTTEDAEQAV